MKRGVVISLMLFLLIPTALGIGLVYPKNYFKIQVPYEPGEEYTLTYKVRTNAGQTIDYEMWAEGDFAPYVTFSPERLNDIPDGSLIPFSVTIKFPETFLKPGPSALDIYVAETENRGGGTMGVRTSTYHTVTIVVPYPYLFATIELEAPNINENQMQRFVLSARNLGEKDIVSARVRINVYDSDYELITTLDSDARPIQSQAEEDFVLTWDTEGIKPGEYIASAKLSYDGAEVASERAFKIGTLRVIVKNYTVEFYPNSINRFDIYVSSLWNSPLLSVYAEVELPGQSLLQTPTIRMDAFGDSLLTAYWDTDGVLPGQKEGKINLYYENQLEEQAILVTVLEEDVEVIPQTSGIMALATASNILIIVIVALIIADVLWMFTRKKR